MTARRSAPAGTRDPLAGAPPACSGAGVDVRRPAQDQHRAAAGAVACTLWITPLAAAGGPATRLPADPVAIVGRHRERGPWSRGNRRCLYGPGDAVVGQLRSCTLQLSRHITHSYYESPSGPPNYWWLNLGNMSFKIPAIFWIIWARIRSGVVGGWPAGPRTSAGWSRPGCPATHFRRLVEAGLPGHALPPAGRGRAAGPGSPATPQRWMPRSTVRISATQAGARPDGAVRPVVSIPSSSDPTHVVSRLAA
jgi:hypothetical protein